MPEDPYSPGVEDQYAWFCRLPRLFSFRFWYIKFTSPFDGINQSLYPLRVKFLALVIKSPLHPAAIHLSVFSNPNPIAGDVPVIGVV